MQACADSYVVGSRAWRRSCTTAGLILEAPRTTIDRVLRRERVGVVEVVMAAAEQEQERRAEAS